MLRIRLQRIGRTNQAVYRIVVAEHARAVKGKFIEILGSYNARNNPKRFVLNKTKYDKWVKKGAKTTPRLEYLIAKASGKEMPAKKPAKAKKASKKATA